MKKLINTSFVYFILAMIAGVFYREFTKFYNFAEKTTLSVVHTHLLTLGMFLFLILAALFKDNIKLLDNKKFKRFYIFYNISLPFFAIMFIIRGIFQVLSIELSATTNAIISGFAGISHIFMLVSFILLFMSLKEILEI